MDNIFIKILKNLNLLDCFDQEGIQFISNITNLRQELNKKALKNNQNWYNWFGTINDKEYPLNLTRIHNAEICKKEVQCYCIDCKKPIKKYTLSQIFVLKLNTKETLNNIAHNFFIRCKHCSSYKNGFEGEKKRRQTCLQRYGVQFTSQIQSKKIKTRETRIKKYGFNYGKQITKKLHNYWKGGKFYRNSGDDPEIRAKQVATWKQTISKKPIEELKVWRDKIIGKNQSNISKEFFNKLTNIIGESVKTQYAIKDEKRSYFLDGYIQNCCIIEFYGNYWHANPQIYNFDEMIQQNKKTIRVCDIWQKDRIRIEGIQKILNLPIVIVWELDYNNNKDEIVKLLTEKIKNKGELENGKIYQLKVQ